MKKILIVTANYYPEISTKLKNGSVESLKDYELNHISVPGVFEIPVIISKNVDNYDAFIALGCVIKGETPHFDLINISVMNGIMDLAIKNKKPIGNGILTCLNKKQAETRLDKGKEAAKAVKEVLENVISK